MRISFIILFMIDLYKDNHVRVCVCKLFPLKTSPQKLLTGFYQISKECSLDRGKKLLFIVTEKSGLWSDTGAQAPLVICMQ